ncbi:MAG: hypothetical protein HY721_08850, partial [Planctomycetes bacterium]|nr:hypothetical protein [Planctomycetota bacterium]
DRDGNGIPDECEPPRFRRGDANGDADHDVSDALAILLALFRGGPPGSCADAMDADDDGQVTIGDAVGLLAYLFLRGLPPAPPFAACGTDPTEDAAACERHGPCE